MSKKQSYSFWAYTSLGVGIATCLYFACWEITASWGAQDVWKAIRGIEQAKLPIETVPRIGLVATPVAVDSMSPCAFVLKTNVSLAGCVENRYYFWFFGSLRQLRSYDRTPSFDNSISLLVTDDFSWESYWDSSDAFRFRSPVPRLLLIGTLSLVFVVVWTLLPNLRKRHWRVRFSLRGLILFVTIACVYCTLWAVTNRWGVRYELGDAHQQRKFVTDGSIRGYAIAPFVVCIESPAETARSDYGNVRPGKHRRYCLWIPANRNIALYPRYLKTLD